MKKIVYREPAFLRDIHCNQTSNYKKSKSESIKERISQVVKEAHKNLDKFGLHAAELIQK